MNVRSIFATAIAVCLVFINAANAAISLVSFTGPADSGISTASTYQLAVDVGEYNNPGLPLSMGGTTVNGVTFVDGESSGPNYSLTNGYVDLHIPYLTATDGLQKMYSTGFCATPSSGENVTISGLTPGTSYSARFYTGNADDSGSVPTQVSAYNDIYSTTLETAIVDPYPGTEWKYVEYDYVAVGTSIIVSFQLQPGAGSNNFNLMAISNQVVPTPEPAIIGLAAVCFGGLIRRRRV